MFDERVPPEVRATFRRAWESLRGLDQALVWAAALGVPPGTLSDVEALLRRLFALDRAHSTSSSPRTVGATSPPRSSRDGSRSTSSRTGS